VLWTRIIQTCMSVLFAALKRRKPTYYVLQRLLWLFRLVPVAFLVEERTARAEKRWALQLHDRR
jgi:hypothetical protein